MNPKTDFLLLQELDFSFNFIENCESLWYLTRAKSIHVCVITGNPFAANPANYADLEQELQKSLAAVLINDADVANNNGFVYKKKNQSKNSLPYPKPIKYEKKETEGNYINAEKLRAGISLQMTDLKPNANIESEIFPK